MRTVKGYDIRKSEHLWALSGHSKQHGLERQKSHFSCCVTCPRLLRKRSSVPLGKHSDFVMCDGTGFHLAAPEAEVRG